MAFVWKKHPFLIGALALGVVLLATAWAARFVLAKMAIATALREAGATEVQFQVTKASPRLVVVEDLDLKMGLQPLSAGRVSVERARWWMASLGTLRVEGARVPVKIDEARTDPSPEKKARPTRLPLDEFSLDGQLVIQAAGAEDQALAVTIVARPDAHGKWKAQTTVAGPGLTLAGEASYELSSGELEFRVPELALDFAPWEAFVRAVAPMPDGDWKIAGKVSGAVEGRMADDGLVARGQVRLREGSVSSAAGDIAAEGIEAELDFTDLVEVQTAPSSVRAREVRTGELTFGDLAAVFALEGTDRIAVSRAAVRALGGHVTAEPFVLVPSEAAIDAVLLAEGISIEEVMALTEDLPAQATGRVNGRVPVRFDEEGLRFGTGWLALQPGVPAEIAFKAKGLLTGGVAPGNPRYTVLQRIESGLLKLRISELRLDIRPPDVPAGRSAQLHLKGEPVDPEVKAPVRLDLNVNGPIEKLINMGLDSRLSIGAGK